MPMRLMKIGAGAVLVAALAGGGAAWATSGDDEGSVTGPAAERARAAALDHLGAGRATEVERESEGDAAWEVEVARVDGSTVEVLLDESYDVIGVESDSEDRDDSDEGEPSE